MSQGDQESWLPEDIFPFIEALERYAQTEWELMMLFMTALVRRHYGPTPTPGVTAEDLAGAVKVELCKPGQLARFHGSEDVGVPTRASFVAYIRTIMWRVRGHLDTHVEATPLVTTAEETGEGVWLDTLVESDPPLIDQIITRELLERVLQRLAQIEAQGAWSATKVRWLWLSAIEKHTYKEIAAAYHCSWQRVRDAIGSVREQLDKVVAAYDAPEPPTTDPPAPPKKRRPARDRLAPPAHAENIARVTIKAHTDLKEEQSK